MKRTLALETTKKLGQKVKVNGWVNSIRSHGQLNFVDVRDRSGIVQVVGGEELKKLRAEFVVEIEGIAKQRPPEMVNPELATGKIEIEAGKIEILAEAKVLPFRVDNDGREIGEEKRLEYRYLDLRRPRLQRNFRIRSNYVQAARKYLFSQDFVEIETPLLTKSTPEGSRDFVVPSRLHPGKFFALPQSPQQYKQLLMVAGFERYFQIARCIRDEDPRADRAFEHTQIDLEMSFVEREEVMKIVEEMTIYGLERIGARIAQKPFPVFSYQQARDRFGADKFDLRSEKEKKQGVMSLAWVIEFPFFKKDQDGNWTFTHNPFSAPIPEHRAWLLEKTKIDQIITTQYDLICNGYEVGGGSLRSHQPGVLKAVFEILGYSEEAIEAQFGHILEAFAYGAPPHGGCAQGFERLLMAYLGEVYLREVQAFPQTGSGRTAVMDSPSELPKEQLEELSLKVILPK